MSTIRILGVEVYAHHGVGDAERELGGRYSFDLEIDTDIADAAASDNLSDTVNYVSAYEIAHDVIVNTKRKLLESIVSQVVQTLLQEIPQAARVTMRLRKLRAPINGVLDAVEIEHSESRDEEKS
jgi:dihydroneopterin aldolase